MNTISRRSFLAGTAVAAGGLALPLPHIVRKAAAQAHLLGLEVHAGHGLTFDTVGPIAAIPELRELNIGHFLIAESVFLGLGPAIREMRRRMDATRA